MTSADSPTGAYTLWEAEYGKAYENPSAVHTQACAGCGHRCLQLRFVVDAGHPEKGRPLFWCSNCDRGIFLCRTDIPEGAERISKEQAEDVPNYQVVVPT
jgi:hypothetical protein